MKEAILWLVETSAHILSRRPPLLYDGPRLERGLTAMQEPSSGPEGNQFGPDRDGLAVRFEQLRRAA